MDFDLLSLRNFFKAIQLYGWPQVLIELTLIGAFVYVVLRFLRGTRGARMIKGVGFVLVVLYLVVRLIGAELKLDRINYLYGRFLLFASFAVVVVFQPEIRRALMRLGETRLFRSLTAQLNAPARNGAVASDVPRAAPRSLTQPEDPQWRTAPTPTRPTTPTPTTCRTAAAGRGSPRSRCSPP